MPTLFSRLLLCAAFLPSLSDLRQPSGGRLTLTNDGWPECASHTPDLAATPSSLFDTPLSIVAAGAARRRIGGSLAPHLSLISAAPTPASPAAPGAPAAATTRVLTFDTFDDSISAAGTQPEKGATPATKSSSEYTKHSMVLLSSIGEGGLDVGAGGRTALVDSPSAATLDELCSALQASSLYSIGTNSIRESNDPSWPTATATISAATISSSLAHPTFVAAQPVCRFSLRRGSLVAGSGHTVGPFRERIAVTKVGECIRGPEAVVWR